MLTVLGLDLSLTSSGWARMVGDRVVTGTLRPGGKLSGAARLSWVCREVSALVDGSSPRLLQGGGGSAGDPVAGAGVVQGVAPVDVVVVEGYSFGSQGRATFSVGELGGAVRVALFDAGVPFVEVPPAVLKKFAAGSGSATKDEVLLAAVRRAGGVFAGMSNDEADAFWLLAAGYEALVSSGSGVRVVGVPAGQVEALGAVDWSAVSGVGGSGAV